jgi:hypothetical protein
VVSELASEERVKEPHGLEGSNNLNGDLTTIVGNSSQCMEPTCKEKKGLARVGRELNGDLHMGSRWQAKEEANDGELWLSSANTDQEIRLHLNECIFVG